MSPFIKATQIEQVAGPEDNTKFIYVNVDHVAKATYSTRDEMLELVVSLPGHGGGFESVKLYGKEARAALKTLKNLP